MKQLALLDFCLPDYFTGYHKPVIAVGIYETMTNKEVAEAIQDEINVTYEWLTGSYSRTEMLLMDHYCEQLLTDPDTIFVTQEEIEGEVDECAYLYFGIIKPVHKYGLTFLNA